MRTQIIFLIFLTFMSCENKNKIKMINSRNKSVLKISTEESNNLLKQNGKLNSPPDYTLSSTNNALAYNLKDSSILIIPQYSPYNNLKERSRFVFMNKETLNEYIEKDNWDDNIYNDWEYFRDDFLNNRHLNKNYFWSKINEKDNFFYDEEGFLNSISKNYSKFIKRKPENYIYIYLKLLESINQKINFNWALEKRYNSVNAYYIPILINRKDNCILDANSQISISLKLISNWTINKTIDEELRNTNMFSEIIWYKEISHGIFISDMRRFSKDNSSLNNVFNDIIDKD
jgi:hypothetical protein